MNLGKKHVEEMGLERLRAGTEGGMGDRSSRRLFCSLGGGGTVQETLLFYLALFSGTLTFWSSVSLFAGLD